MSFVLELNYEDPERNNLPCLSCLNLCEEYRAFERLLDEYLWQKEQVLEIQRETGEKVVLQDLETAKTMVATRCKSIATKIEEEDCYRK